MVRVGDPTYTGPRRSVIAREIDVRESSAATAREQPDVALVGLGLASEHALELITKIVHKASCPVDNRPAEGDRPGLVGSSKPAVSPTAMPAQLFVRTSTAA